jgi:hypothetical protein
LWRIVNENIQCYNCKEFGHFASDYSQYKFENKNVNFAEKETNSEEPVLLLACGNFDGNNSSTWYLDTGASNHMCGMNFDGSNSKLTYKLLPFKQTKVLCSF